MRDPNNTDDRGELLDLLNWAEEELEALADVYKRTKKKLLAPFVQALIERKGTRASYYEYTDVDIYIMTGGLSLPMVFAYRKYPDEQQLAWIAFTDSSDEAPEVFLVPLDRFLLGEFTDDELLSNEELMQIDAEKRQESKERLEYERLKRKYEKL